MLVDVEGVGAVVFSSDVQVYDCCADGELFEGDVGEPVGESGPDSEGPVGGVGVETDGSCRGLVRGRRRVRGVAGR